MTCMEVYIRDEIMKTARKRRVGRSLAAQGGTRKIMAIAKFLLIGSLLGVSVREIYGHGMMMDPVQRSSAWRKGFPVEPNYNDNELFCGGMNVQFEQNGGKCGECGDNYALPRARPNENGGIYGTGLVVRRYNRSETINVNVKLTANHRGTFKFDLCLLERSNELETEDCFGRHPLLLADGSSSVPVPSTRMEFNVPIRLPGNVTCDRCVLRWTYRAGNNWGDCGDGQFAMGCGHQETFKNCADVAIL